MWTTQHGNLTFDRLSVSVSQHQIQYSDAREKHSEFTFLSDLEGPMRPSPDGTTARQAELQDYERLTRMKADQDTGRPTASSRHLQATRCDRKKIP